MNTLEAIKVLEDKEKSVSLKEEKELYKALVIAIITMKESNFAISDLTNKMDIENAVKKAQRFKKACRVFIAIFSGIIGFVLGIALSYATL